MKAVHVAAFLILLFHLIIICLKFAHLFFQKITWHASQARQLMPGWWNGRHAGLKIL